MACKTDRYSALLVSTVVTFFGAALGDHLGLHGFDQWPLAGFEFGLVLLTNAVGAGRLVGRVKELEAQIAALKAGQPAQPASRARLRFPFAGPWQRT